MSKKEISRRAFLARTAALGCSAAASPLLTPVSLAAAPTDARLVVIILRGGMDGLDAVRPVGDPGFAEARKGLLKAPPEANLDGFFGLHRGLDALMPLWQSGELAFAHAVSTPYRGKRSHFDGQDLLETGFASLDGRSLSQGWLNRALEGMSGVQSQTAFAIGEEPMLVLSGNAPVSNWSPQLDLTASPQALRLLDMVMQSDPEMHAAMVEAVLLAESDGDSVLQYGGRQGMMDAMREDRAAAKGTKAHLLVPEFAARQLRGETRIASFSMIGWDSHARQGQILTRSLKNLADTILELRSGVGPEIWARTTVLCMTEFGRTVRENGTGGTDHGTGGALIMAGGAVRGGKVYGQWPGLGESDLYEGRDLMATRDVRAYAGWALHRVLGLGKGRIEGSVFPGLDLGPDPGAFL